MPEVNLALLNFKSPAMPVVGSKSARLMPRDLILSDGSSAELVFVEVELLVVSLVVAPLFAVSVDLLPNSQKVRIANTTNSGRAIKRNIFRVRLM